MFIKPPLYLKVKQSGKIIGGKAESAKRGKKTHKQRSCMQRVRCRAPVSVVAAGISPFILGQHALGWMLPKVWHDISGTGR
jgi:hypothetical protein